VKRDQPASAMTATPPNLADPPEAAAARRRQAETPSLAADAATREGAAHDLAAAFAADPVFDWFLKEGPGRPAVLIDFFRLVLKLTGPQGARVERPADGGAAALWLRSEDMGDFPLAGELSIAALMLRGCGLGRIRRVLAVRAAMDAHHPQDRAHDYLYFLGVRPQFQGLGIGSRLLRSHLAGLDAAGRPAFLETGNPRTLTLYQSHGFAITGDYRPAGGGPVLWTLWREPQTS
jgi:ribosomal protein S18 acetylase RimI-like enzyme